MDDLKAHEQEESLEQIFEHISAVVPYVSEIINGGTAGVHFDGPFLERTESLHLSAERIEQLNHEKILSKFVNRESIFFVRTPLYVGRKLGRTPQKNSTKRDSVSRSAPLLTAWGNCAIICGFTGKSEA